MSTQQERLIEGAIALIAQGEVAPREEAKAARGALDQWCRKSAEHEAAAREARRRWDALGGMAADLRAHFEGPDGAEANAPSPPRIHQRRRLLLCVAALLGTGAFVGRGVQWYWQQPVFTASYGTRNAQLLALRLLDGPSLTPGSRLDLAPRSAIDVALYRQRRVVHMTGGEVRFDVDRDEERPFEVLIRGARIEVVGTVFTVRDRGGPITVGVERGQVRVQLLRQHSGRAATSSAPAIELRPGEILDIRDGSAEAVRHADAAALSVWRDGWLVFENASLKDALSTINAYRTEPIFSTDPGINALSFSGRFRANDSAGLIAVLPTILPLTTRARPDGSVELHPR